MGPCLGSCPYGSREPDSRGRNNMEKARDPRPTLWGSARKQPSFGPCICLHAGTHPRPPNHLPYPLTIARSISRPHNEPVTLVLSLAALTHPCYPPMMPNPLLGYAPAQRTNPPPEYGLWQMSPSTGSCMTPQDPSLPTAKLLVRYRDPTCSRRSPWAPE